MSLSIIFNCCYSIWYNYLLNYLIICKYSFTKYFNTIWYFIWINQNYDTSQGRKWPIVLKESVKNFPHILNIKKNQANNSKSKYDFIFKLKKGDINLNSMNNLNSHDPKSEHNKFPNIKLNS